jgi:2-C-methyl-D-erythritol 4-phosphate cytidylyltransferase
MSSSRLFVLIPCAGSGHRAGHAQSPQPKQYRRLAGLPMVAHTLEAFRALAGRFAGLALVVSPEDRDVDAVLPRFPAENEYLLRVGGLTRAATVRNGLAALRQKGAGAHDWVLVHDAARCLLRPEWVQRLISACADDEVGGLLALPVADTLKASNAGRASQTISRVNKWAAQTPQMFRLGLLQGALNHALSSPDVDVTDEASAVEHLGHAPLLVAGEMENFKLTWPADFALAARLMETR